MSLREWANRPRVIRRINGWATVAWLVLVVPTVGLKSWRTSILWVALLSIWANVISHYTAWLAARVEVREEHIEEEIRE